MTRQTRIPADHVDAYERWEMPDLTGVRRSISRRLQELEAQREAEASAEHAAAEDDAAPVETLSDEEVEALKAQAYEDGRQEGLTTGHAEGYEHGRAQGYASGEREGSEAGFQSGYEKGLEQARNEIDQLSARFQSQLDQLLHPLAHVDDDAEQALLELAELIATGVLRRELTIDRSSLTHIVQEALSALPDTSRRLRIHVNPDDKVLVEAACEGRFDDYRIVEDPEVTPGGVHIETQYSLVDCTVERRYRALVEKLMGEQYPDHPPAEGPLPRRAESDSPLGPGHFSAEAALAELESLRAELAAALGDDAAVSEVPVGQSDSPSANTSSGNTPSASLQSGGMREASSAEEATSTSFVSRPENDAALATQQAADSSSSDAHSDKRDSSEESRSGRSEEAVTDQPPQAQGVDESSESSGAQDADSISRSSGRFESEPTESVTTSQATDSADALVSSEKPEPVRVSLSSSSSHTSPTDSASARSREMPDETSSVSSSASPEEPVTDAETGGAAPRSDSTDDASAADLVTQAAASVQQSAQDHPEHHNDGDAAFPSGETSSVYEDRYSLEEVEDTALKDFDSVPSESSGRSVEGAADAEQKEEAPEKSSHE